MSKTTVTYKDIAVGADEDAAVSAVGAANFSELDQLPFGLENAPVIALEQNYWILDGTRVFRDTQRLAFWSESLSGEDGAFAAPPSLTIDFDEQYSLLGIYLSFDTATGEYCSSINVKYYQQDTLKANYDFSPDSVEYFCSGKAESFDRIVLTLNATSLPYRRAKLTKIVFGIHRNFGMSEIRSAKIINEVGLVSSELPVSKFSWTLDSRDDVEFLFQLKQPVEVANNGNLIGVYYIDESKRTAKGIYNIECHDAFGVLSEIPFVGGAYLGGVSAQSLFTEIVGADFEVEYGLADTTLYGVIKPCTRREAAQQVLFAWGAVATTDGRNGVKVFSLSDELNAVGQERTYNGVSVNTAAIVTKVQVKAHIYTQDDSGSIEINGITYKDTESLYEIVNPNVTATDKANVKEVSGATLVSTSNGQEVAQRMYDYYTKRNTNRAKIVWNGERLGDYVSLPTAWGTEHAGHIKKMTITLSNTVAADVETVGV